MSNTPRICAVSSALLGAMMLGGCMVPEPGDRVAENCAAGDQPSCEVLERRADLPQTMRAPTSSAEPRMWPSAGVTVGSGGRMGGGVALGIGVDPFGDPWRDPFRRQDGW